MEKEYNNIQRVSEVILKEIKASDDFEQKKNALTMMFLTGSLILTDLSPDKISEGDKEEEALYVVSKLFSNLLIWVFKSQETIDNLTQQVATLTVKIGKE